ncbi:hypothetical protein [Jeotgalibaca porci]|uniref:hypothetical protein n=1 Tax=Jeotgalibaca porci TaxID=1868793 RepID=UPI0035A1D070
MKKKDTFIVIILGIITIAVIGFGFRYRQNKQAELMGTNSHSEINQSDNFDTRKNEQTEKKRANFLSAFDENRESNTVGDFLQYVNYAKGNSKIAFYGEAADQETWTVNTVHQLKNENDLPELETHYLSTLDSEVLTERLSELTEINPDVVFFHTPMPLYNYISWTEDGPVEKDNITDIISTYAEIKHALPNSLVVLVTPFPQAADPESEEEESWHQVDIDALLVRAEEYAIPVFNLHNEMMEYVTLNEMAIADLYENEELADVSQEVAKDIFLNVIKTTKVDTSTAFIIDGEPKKVEIEIESESSLESVEEVIEESEPVEIEEEWSEEETEVEVWVPTPAPPAPPSENTGGATESSTSSSSSSNSESSSTSGASSESVQSTEPVDEVESSSINEAPE